MLDWSDVVAGAVDGIIAMSEGGAIESFNPAAGRLFGYAPREIIGRNIGILMSLSDLERYNKHTAEYLKRKRVPERANSLEVTGKRRDGTTFPMELSLGKICSAGRNAVASIVRDISERQRMEKLAALQGRILEMIATNESLQNILAEICLLVEAQKQDVLCSTMLFEMSEKKLYVGAAPTLPAEAVRALDGLVIGECAGSCGTAAYSGELVVVSNTATDPRWSASCFRDFSSRFNVRACWSCPFFSKDREILGTFAISHLRTASPTPHDRKLLTTAAHLAGISVERKKTEENIRKAHDQLGELVRERSEELERTNARLEQELSQRRSLERRLVQSQRMEAIGQLAGGVAHDFNNLLMAINGYSERIISRLGPGDSRRKDLEEIRRNGERGVKLAQQLLAFGRRQVLAPTALNLNAILADIQNLLEHTIGEDVELRVSQAPGLWEISADGGQIEQVIMNLALNARDAMPQGGRLLLETQNIRLDEAYCRNHEGVSPGSHVLLSVTDSGEGMDSQILEHIFEPFFTTKEVGKGTGLGLATVYGIIKQSGGHISVYSEPGMGTTFKVFFPRVGEGEHAEKLRDESATPEVGRRTILVVEDGASVRQLVCAILLDEGYTILEACNGRKAVEISGQHQGPIDLILTDVVMPEMSGPDLVERLTLQRKGMEVIYMSGYAKNMIDAQGEIDPGIVFLQKPFSLELLLEKVREALGENGQKRDSKEQA